MNRDYSILKKYVCLSPFKRLEIFEDKIYPCCVSWIKTPIGFTDNLKNISSNDMLHKVRKSILDGEYEYCDKYKCPNLVELLYTKNVVGDFRRKDAYDEEILINSNKFTEIKLNLDDSCNLSCGSCRKNFIMSDNKKTNKLKIKLDEIVDIFGKDLKSIDISGTSDPFASKLFRDFLINFDESKFPNLKNISFYTNGILLNENMWNKLSHIHKYINTIQISIDAATKETYEKIRRGGNWETLMKNINFLLTLPNIKKMEYMYIIQDTNYKEMESFIMLINSLPHNCAYNIYFTKIYNWDTYTDDEYKQKKIWDESHIEFDNFLKELSKIVNEHGVYNDLWDIVNKYSLKPNKHLL